MSRVKFRYDVDVSKIKTEDTNLVLDTEKGIVNIAIDDVIGCKARDNCKDVKKLVDISKTANASVLYVVRIEESKEPVMKLGVVNVSGEDIATKGLIDKIRGKLSDLKRPKKLVVFLNPIGGKQTARSTFSDKFAPLLNLSDIEYQLLVSERANHMTELVNNCDFSGVDGILVLGGDGTLGEVINALVIKNQGTDLSTIHKATNIMEIPIGIIPTGTANVMCWNTHGTRDLITSILHVIKGGVVKRGLKGVYSEGRLLAVACWSTAYGYFSDMMYYNDKMRWLRQLRVLVVIPWFCFFKSQRLFDVEAVCTLRKDGQQSEGDNPSDSETKEIKGRHCVVMSMNANMVDENKLLNKRTDFYENDDFALFFYRPCPRLGILQQIGQLYKQNPEAFKKDFLDGYDATEVKVKIQRKENSSRSYEAPQPGKSPGKRQNESDESYLERVINIDGEMYEFGDGEFTIRFHPESIMYFHS